MTLLLMIQLTLVQGPANHNNYMSINFNISLIVTNRKRKKKTTIPLQFTPHGGSSAYFQTSVLFERNAIMNESGALCFDHNCLQQNKVCI